jgi:hypothetical protein
VCTCELRVGTDAVFHSEVLLVERLAARPAFALPCGVGLVVRFGIAGEDRPDDARVEGVDEISAGIGEHVQIASKAPCPFQEGAYCLLLVLAAGVRQRPQRLVITGPRRIKQVGADIVQAYGHSGIGEPPQRVDLEQTFRWAAPQRDQHDLRGAQLVAEDPLEDRHVVLALDQQKAGHVASSSPRSKPTEPATASSAATSGGSNGMTWMRPFNLLTWTNRGPGGNERKALE